MQGERSMKSKYYESFEYDVNHSDPGREIQAKYDILEEIYRSEQSVLNRIVDKQTSKSYVLKGILKKKGFSFDVDKIKMIESPSINRVHESYESDYFIYLIEDFVEGLNLEQYVKENGVLDEKEAKRVILQIAHALHDLHYHNESIYVFRDLKPSNIMIQPNGEIVLIDVITIREVKKNQTQDTFLIGSKGYTAPEAYGFMQTTEKSDIYSLGATLSFLLTGQQPANISSFKALLADKKEIKRYLKSVIFKSTAFKPEERFEDVMTFIRAIEDEKLKISTFMKRILLIAILLVIVIVAGAINIFSKDDSVTRTNDSNLKTQASNIEFYDIEEVMRKEEFKVTDLMLLTKGVELELNDTNVLKITFDRTLLPESVKDFAYISVGTSAHKLTMKQWSSDIYDGLVNGDGYQGCVDTGFLSQLRDDTNLYVVLYSVYREPVAYYINTEFRSELSVKSSVNPETEVSLSGVYEIEDGIYFEYYEDQASLFVDQEKVADFSNVSIWGNSNPFTQENIQYIQNEISEGRSIQVYQENGVSTGYGDVGSFAGNYWLIYLLDDDNKIIKELRIDK